MNLPALPLVAGTLSTVLFVISYLPMLIKAARTRDLSSYSIGNLLLANIGNAVHSLYVYSLPMGPIWFLHTFYLASTALMLFWFWRYRARRAPEDHQLSTVEDTGPSGPAVLPQPRPDVGPAEAPAVQRRPAALERIASR